MCCGRGQKTGDDVRAMCRCADVRSCVCVEITTAWPEGNEMKGKLGVDNR